MPNLGLPVSLLGVRAGGGGGSLCGNTCSRRKGVVFFFVVCPFETLFEFCHLVVTPHVSFLSFVSPLFIKGYVSEATWPYFVLKILFMNKFSTWANLESC